MTANRFAPYLFIVALLASTVSLTAGCSSDSPSAPAASPVISQSTFNTDIEGWSSGTSGKALDSVRHMSNGYVKLDGSDFGTPDNQPNSWIFKEITLASNARSLRFQSSAHDRDDADSHLRVRLVDSKQTSHTIMDWEVQSGTENELVFETRWIDIASFAGQTVTIYFEQGDNDRGAGEQRYIDDIQIRSDVAR